MSFFDNLTKPTEGFPILETVFLQTPVGAFSAGPKKRRFGNKFLKMPRWYADFLDRKAVHTLRWVWIWAQILSTLIKTHRRCAHFLDRFWAHHLRCPGNTDQHFDPTCKTAPKVCSLFRPFLGHPEPATFPNNQLNCSSPVDCLGKQSAWQMRTGVCVDANSSRVFNPKKCPSRKTQKFGQNHFRHWKKLHLHQLKWHPNFGPNKVSIQQDTEIQPKSISTL
jgi:hypothetical protein